MQTQGVLQSDTFSKEGNSHKGLHLTPKDCCEELLENFQVRTMI